MIKSWQAVGTVQGVMFRQTFIKAAIHRGLHAGATNTSNHNEVTFTIEGKDDAIKDFVKQIETLPELNYWAAHADTVTELAESIPFQEHQVTTDNVDEFKWSPGVVFFLK